MAEGNRHGDERNGRTGGGERRSPGQMRDQARCGRDPDHDKRCRPGERALNGLASRPWASRVATRAAAPPAPRR
jgi:hypothetical protein